MRAISEVFSRPHRADMVPEFVLARAQAHDAAARDRRGERLAHSAASAQAKAATHKLRSGVREALGLDRLPMVESAVYGECFDFPHYRVQKLVFEAVAGLRVPALLYLPAGRGPHPAVVHPPGHWMEDAKLAEPIQLLNQRLARLGITTLCFDPIGQGERRIGWHQHGQLAPLLVGVTTLGAMVAENIGAIGVLEARPDIDASRIGMIGASGGGFTTLFAAALDSRVSVAVVSSIVNSHRGQMRDAAFGTGWDGWVDLCNQIPGLCTVGNLGDILGLIAPRALMVANAEDDPPFPLDGAREVANEVATIYRALAAPDSFRFTVVPGTHGFQPAMRAATVAYLVEALRVGTEHEGDSSMEECHPDFAPRWPVPHNRATARKPQSNAPISSRGTCLRAPVDTNEILVAIAKERAASLAAHRVPLTASLVAQAIGPLPTEPSAPRPQVENHVVLDGFEAQRLTLDIEPGITLDCVFTLPRNWTDDLAPVLILIDEGGKEPAFQSLERQIAADGGWAVLLPDLRGTGESAMSEFEVATAAWMTDRDLLNQRIWDVVRLVDFLSDRYSSAQQVDKSRILVWGRGAMGLVALCAAAVDDRITAAGSDDVVSILDLMTVNSRRSPMLYRYNLLSWLDIPDLRKYIEPRLTEIGGVGAFRSLIDHLGRGQSNRDMATRYNSLVE